MDHHVVAAVSLAGIFLDVLGGLYLAYDLLGGQYGPLRLLTRIVTYSILFGIGYGIGLGLIFGVACGLATGITVSVELQRTAHRHDHYPLGWEAVFSGIRGLAFGAALYRTLSFQFAFTFAVLLTAGQVVAYSQGMRPGLEYLAARHPRLTRRHAWGMVARTVGYTAAALLCSALEHQAEGGWPFAIRLGMVSGVVTGVGMTFTPFIEYYADNLPERRLGVFGIWLVLCGFALQSFQYWLAILDVQVT